MFSSAAGAAVPSVQIGVGRLASATVGAFHGFSALDTIRAVRAAVAVEHSGWVGLARAVPTTGHAVRFAFFVKCCILDNKEVAQKLEICCEWLQWLTKDSYLLVYLSPFVNQNAQWARS